MRKYAEQQLQVCPIIATLGVIGGKWKPALLWQIRLGVCRFGALQRSVDGITQKMLTQQLSELEADGIVFRRVYAEVPPRVEYTLTPYGQSLQVVLEGMAAWGAAHQRRNSMNSAVKPVTRGAPKRLAREAAPVRA